MEVYYLAISEIQMLNWFAIAQIFERTNEEDKPYVEAQLILKKIADDMPASHPLKNKAFIVGGTVRDEVLGKVPKDIDVVAAYPNGGVKLAEYISSVLNLRKPIIFPTYGTAQLVLPNGIGVEFVQTRKEQYHTDSRKPETSFGTIQEDISRRDFTVNTLMKPLNAGPLIGDDLKRAKNSGVIVDTTGIAFSDIQNGIIRTAAAPDITFSDDPLRMLRGIRFSVKYGWQMTDETKQGILRNLSRLSIVSKERVKEEIDKVIGYGKLHVALPLMDELGLLDLILPEFSALKGVKQGEKHHAEGDVFVHSLIAIQKLEERYPGSSIPVVWAMLAHDWGKKATFSNENGQIHFYGHEDVSAELVVQRMRELKYPNDVIEKTKRLVASHMRSQGAHKWNPKSFRKLHREMGDDYEDVLKIMEADELAAISEEKGETRYNFQHIRNKMPEMLTQKVTGKPLLNGNEIIDILKKFIPNAKPGPIVGKVMALQTEFLDENPTDDKVEMENRIVNSQVFKRIIQDVVGNDNV